MSVSLKLSSKSILEKNFSHEPRGYNTLSVDEFLDKIISDYKVVEQNYLMSKEEMDSYKNKITELESKNQQLQIELESFKNKMAGLDLNGNINSDNIDLLKRINTLETYIWKNDGINPKTIK